MAHLTNEQINDIAEDCKCGYFEYGDAQGDVRLDFARAIEAACQIGRVCVSCGVPISDHYSHCQRLWSS